VLFGPQRNEFLRQPGSECEQPVDTNVAGGADNDQPVGVVKPGPPVMDVEAILPCPADPAHAAVPRQNFFPMPGEARPRMRPGPITPSAQSGDGGRGIAAGAEQDPLPNAPVDNTRSAVTLTDTTSHVHDPNRSTISCHQPSSSCPVQAHQPAFAFPRRVVSLG
jgi:hypothetical protein